MVVYFSKKNDIKHTVKVFGKFKLIANPLSGSVLSKIFKILDINAVDTSYQGKYSLALFFDDLITMNDNSAVKEYRKQIEEEENLNTCNMHLLGTSKTQVGASYEHAFKRKINLRKIDLIDDVSYVLKSEGQAAHDGIIQNGKALKQFDIKGR
jgi:hypothetical protein